MDFSTFSDDQVALMGCAVAFIVSGFMMVMSFYVGNRGKQQETARKQILTTARRNAESMNKAA